MGPVHHKPDTAWCGYSDLPPGGETVATLPDQTCIISITTTVISSRQGPRAAGAACRLCTRPVGGPQQPAEKPEAGDTDSRAQQSARLPLYPWGVGLYKPPRAPMQRVPNQLELDSHIERGEGEPCLLPPLAYSSRSTIVLTSALVIMRRPRGAGLGVLSSRRGPNLGKVRRRSCLCLIPLPRTGDVLLAPTMISHPLAYVAPNPRHLAPTVGRGAPSPRDLFWMGTLFLPGERS